MDLEHVRAEIERMRLQVNRQKKEILQLQRAGIPTAAAELLLARMHTTIDGLCEKRDQLRKAEPGPGEGRCFGWPTMVSGPLRWYEHDDPANPPWIKALAEVRHLATRECYPHVQAIIVSIDQYAEAALGNRDYFLNKPYSIGGSRKSGGVP
jgi:hypothetical protein